MEKTIIITDDAVSFYLEDGQEVKVKRDGWTISGVETCDEFSVADNGDVCISFDQSNSDMGIMGFHVTKSNSGEAIIDYINEQDEGICLMFCKDEKDNFSFSLYSSVPAIWSLKNTSKDTVSSQSKNVKNILPRCNSSRKKTFSPQLT